MADVELPTATQLVALGHDTALSVAPVGFGLETTDQLAPSQRSIATPGYGFPKDPRIPTAKQLVALEHDTPVHGVAEGTNGLALGVIDHVGTELDSVTGAATELANGPLSSRPIASNVAGRARARAYGSKRDRFPASPRRRMRPPHARHNGTHPCAPRCQELPI